MIERMLLEQRCAGRGHSRSLLACLILTVVCLVNSSANAQLRFRAESAHTGVWRHAYSQFPAIWKAHRIVVVREISDAEMDRLVEQFEGPSDKSDSIVDGCYQATTDNEETAGRITLRESLHGENATLVFVHEYGHYVWSNVLTGADRVRYRRIWREQKRIGNLITEYAGDSDEEGFAEAFAYFIRRPAMLRRLDARSSRFLGDFQERDTVEGDSSDREP
jgi:hypothetical protein